MSLDYAAFKELNKLGGICKAYVGNAVGESSLFHAWLLFASVPNGATYYKTRTSKNEGPHLRTGTVVVHLEFQDPKKLNKKLLSSLVAMDFRLPPTRTTRRCQLYSFFPFF